jgi:hypothetical protein
VSYLSFNTTIFFDSNKSQVLADLKQFDEAYGKIKDTGKQTSDNIVSATQSSLLLQANSTILKKQNETEVARLLVDIADISGEVNHLQNKIDTEKTSQTWMTRWQNQLDAKQGLLTLKNMQLETMLEGQERRVSTLKQELHHIGAIVSATSGFLSLLFAISGSQQDQAISTTMSIVSSALQIAIVYGTLAAATGNWAMLAAAGSAASSAASIINTVRSVGERQRNAQEVEQRRLQNLKM